MDFSSGRATLRADVNGDQDQSPMCSMPQRFLTTEWRIVLTASQQGESQIEALEQLCRTYWYPLYCYVRRRGHSPEDAQDLTQEFFARLLEKNWLNHIKPEGGRFRSFLLTALTRFL